MILLMRKLQVAGGAFQPGAGRPQMDFAAVHEEVAALDPELAEAEAPGELIVEPAAFGLQLQCVEIGLLDIPETRIGPRPGKRYLLRCAFGHAGVSLKGLLLFALLVHQVGDEVRRGPRPRRSVPPRPSTASAVSRAG